jgi:hypothetical protein
VLKGIPIGDIINKNNSVAATIIRSGDSPKPLLPSGVPDLHFDGFPTKLNSFDLEIHADGRDVVVAEYILREANKDARLSGPGIANEEDLWN